MKSIYVVLLHNHIEFEGTETLFYGGYTTYKTAYNDVIAGWSGFEYEFTNALNISVQIYKAKGAFKTLLFDKYVLKNGKIQSRPKRIL